MTYQPNLVLGTMEDINGTRVACTALIRYKFECCDSVSNKENIQEAAARLTVHAGLRSG